MKFLMILFVKVFQFEGECRSSSVDYSGRYSYLVMLVQFLCCVFNTALGYTAANVPPFLLSFFLFIIIFFLLLFVCFICLNLRVFQFQFESLESPCPIFLLLSVLLFFGIICYILLQFLCFFWLFLFLIIIIFFGGVCSCSGLTLSDYIHTHIIYTHMHAQINAYIFFPLRISSTTLVFPL